MLALFIEKHIPSPLVWDGSFSVKSMFVHSGVCFMAGSINVPVGPGITADFIVVNYYSGLFVSTYFNYFIAYSLF